MKVENSRISHCQKRRYAHGSPHSRFRDCRDPLDCPRPLCTCHSRGPYLAYYKLHPWKTERLTAPCVPITFTTGTVSRERREASSETSSTQGTKVNQR